MKLNQAGKSTAFIAQRLQVSEEEVVMVIENIKLTSAMFDKGGYAESQKAWYNICNIYQALGQSLRAYALGGLTQLPYGSDEIRKMIVEGDVEQTVKNIMSAGLLIRPFKKVVLPASDDQDPVKN